MIPNIKLINNRGENGGQFIVAVDDKSKIQYIRNLLTEMRQEEPNEGWKIQTIGTLAVWQDAIDWNGV